MWRYAFLLQANPAISVVGIVKHIKKWSVGVAGSLVGTEAKVVRGCRLIKKRVALSANGGLCGNDSYEPCHH